MGDLLKSQRNLRMFLFSIYKATEVTVSNYLRCCQIPAEEISGELQWPTKPYCPFESKVAKPRLVPPFPMLPMRAYCLPTKGWFEDRFSRNCNKWLCKTQNFVLSQTQTFYPESEHYLTPDYLKISNANCERETTFILPFSAVIVSWCQTS